MINMFNLFKKDNSSVVHVNDMDNLIGHVEIIDIREPFECKSGSLKTAKNIPMDTLLSAPEKYLDKEKTYYIMCHSGGRSSITTRALSKQGYHVINVAGGMASYVGAKRK